LRETEVGLTEILIQLILRESSETNGGAEADGKEGKRQ
jgi:hypothetical protein